MKLRRSTAKENNAPINRPNNMSKKLKSLEEHNKEFTEIYISRSIPNGIACPKCNNELYDTEDLVTLSFPPKRSIMCTKCNYTGYRIA